MQGDVTRTAHWPRALDPVRLWGFVVDDGALAECSPHVRATAVEAQRS